MEKEKPTKPKKNMILKFLPKAATATVIFQNHPFSPGREKRLHHHNNHKGFSGPIISIIPAEARNRKSNNVTNQEPTSPKVSCIGQIKQRKNKTTKMKKEKATNTKIPLEKIPSKTKSSKYNFRNIFQRARKFDVDDNTSIASEVVPNSAPCLGHMRKFASGREGNLSNFDWKNVQITPEDRRKYYSDDDREDYTDGDEEDEEVIIPFSAPILVGRDNRPNFPSEPKKEINLWKRRTMTKPNPLQLKK
ncbi:putative thioredoxin-like protein CDSP32, chloroplastic-like [Capsicum annuum]|uniref:uncharacterized protein At1g76070 n=1 Tax=Capsicum annuum TaxID=4072 RepID=UPI0007BEEBB1|nr:uncharacterized protein At1g76070 [Capsicum annuum]KAF3627314.1 putative thioredoxin-like protein CDSP32, chloroplastic-like [Capsicum annuum]